MGAAGIEPATLRRCRQVADKPPSTSSPRFIDGLPAVVERGTPLAEVLRAQAADVREAGKRRLWQPGGRKEFAIMVTSVR